MSMNTEKFCDAYIHTQKHINVCFMHPPSTHTHKGVMRHETPSYCVLIVCKYLHPKEQ